MAKVSYTESQIQSWIFDLNRLNVSKDRMRILIDDVSFSILSNGSGSFSTQDREWRTQVGWIFDVAIFRASWLHSPCIQALTGGLPLDFDQVKEPAK